MKKWLLIYRIWISELFVLMSFKIFVPFDKKYFWYRKFTPTFYKSLIDLLIFVQAIWTPKTIKSKKSNTQLKVLYILSYTWINFHPLTSKRNNHHGYWNGWRTIWFRNCYKYCTTNYFLWNKYMMFFAFLSSFLVGRYNIYIYRISLLLLSRCC